MADESEVQVPAQPQPNPAQERITELSSKVKEEAEGRVAAETKAAEAEKKMVFAEGFADIVGQYPAAKEFKADIQTKVNAGYSVSDATVVVLNGAGKLGTQGPVVEPPNPAGGSASTALPQTGMAKSVSEMSTTEKRDALSGLSATELFSPFRGS